MKTNVYQIVTDRIVEQMSKGIIPWRQPWNRVGQAFALNYVTRRPYSALNCMLLGKQGEYLTWKQIQTLGGKLKKGSKSKFVVFFDMIRIKDDKKAIVKDSETEQTETSGKTEKDTKVIPLLKYYNVFHVDDVEGIESRISEDKPVESNVKPVEEAERVIAGYLDRESTLRFVNDSPSNKAYYSPMQDMVVVPMISQYKVADEYYSTAFHELTHSTLKKSRCNREMTGAIAAFGSENYSREELVAEIGAAMLCNTCGLDAESAFRNSVAYIQSWASMLKSDPKAIVWASTRAEKASKYILGIEA